MEVYLEKKDFQFLFSSGDMLTFNWIWRPMTRSRLAADFVGDQAVFLQDGMKTLVQLYEGKTHRHQITSAGDAQRSPEADPVLRGSHLRHSYKNAVLENGLKILVPPFVRGGPRRS